jgi:hypothetical protein
MNANMKRPCANCPFLKFGAIYLREGRVAEIVADQEADDRSTFQCHKTLERRGNESMCVGAAIYGLKAGRPSVAVRFAIAVGLQSHDALMAQANAIIDVITPERIRKPAARRRRVA